MVQSAIRFCQNQLETSDFELEKIYLLGEGSKIQGLSSFLQDFFECPVEFLPCSLDLSPLPGKNKEDFLHHWQELAPSLGAVVFHREDEFALNLLPLEWKKRYQFRHQKVFLFGAALLLLGYLLFGLVLGVTLRSQANAKWEFMEEEMAKAKKLEWEWKQLREKNQKLLRLAQALNQSGSFTHLTLLLLHHIQQSLPEGVYLRRFSLVERSFEQSRCKYQILCRADNSQRKGALKIQEFQKRLKASPFVKKVHLSPGTSVPEKPNEVQYTIQVECQQP